MTTANCSTNIHPFNRVPAFTNAGLQSQFSELYSLLDCAASKLDSLEVVGAESIDNVLQFVLCRLESLEDQASALAQKDNSDFEAFVLKHGIEAGLEKVKRGGE